MVVGQEIEISWDRSNNHLSWPNDLHQGFPVKDSISPPREHGWEVSNKMVILQGTFQIQTIIWADDIWVKICGDKDWGKLGHKEEGTMWRL